MKATGLTVMWSIAWSAAARESVRAVWRDIYNIMMLVYARCKIVFGVREMTIVWSVHSQPNLAKKDVY